MISHIISQDAKIRKFPYLCNHINDLGKEKISSKAIWNEASKAGLVLGLVSTAYMFITTFTAKISASGVAAAMGISIMNFVLWAAKFGGCIWLMRFFMKKLVADYSGVYNSDTYKLGVRTALLSALIYAAATMANYLFISPDEMKATMDTMMSGYKSMLDSNSLESINLMMDKLPLISFFSTLIYSFLFGWVLSLIFSKSIPSRDPFADMDSENNDTDTQE